MRIQISLELLIYIALSGASLLFVSEMLAVKLPGMYNETSAYSIEAVVNKINSLAMLGSANSSISTFIPIGMCNSTIKNSELETRYGAFYINPSIEIGNAFCPDNVKAELSISYTGGKMLLGRLN
jgi:hypothetical protein